VSAQDYEWLREGLVGLRHRELYLHNAEFHAQIDALNQMLPLMIDGLALQAEKVGDHQPAELVELQTAQPTPHDRARFLNMSMEQYAVARLVDRKRPCP
jgi:hypothetical protein